MGEGNFINLFLANCCESNLYAISVAQQRSTAIQDVAKRAAGYGIPGITVDGMDVLKVYEAANKVIKRARNGGGQH